MTDYGQALEFGIFATPAAADLDHLLGLARLADVSGLDLFTLQTTRTSPRSGTR